MMTLMSALIISENPINPRRGVVASDLVILFCMNFY